ncbi:6-bladed beta-propeller [Pedobacter sp. GR22-6]|uniref:6-bladed beta-propeller n=1 Tax=Pedobacter sp. GR22-6 TaxID=3127957 RepID=UPI00307F751F
MEIRFDPAMAGGLPASDIFDQVTYIPLETTKESAFGTISQLYCTDKYFIIFDQTTSAILIFLNNGRFLRKILKDPYSGPKIYFDRPRERIMVPKGSNLLAYSLEGELLSNLPTPHIGVPYFLTKNTTVYYDYRVSNEHLPDTVNHELYIVQDGIRRAEFLPYNMKNNVVRNFDWLSVNHQPFYDTSADSIAFYCKPYDYGVFQITPSGVKKVYQLVLPMSLTFPDSLLTSGHYKQGTLRSFFEGNIEKVNGLSFTYTLKNSFFFKLNDYNSSIHDSYIYNLETGNVVSTGSISGDQLTSFLPITDFTSGTEFMNRNFLTVDTACIYCSIPPAALFKAYESRDNKKQEYAPLLVTLFNKGSRTDNPVIVRLRPKHLY